MCSMPSTCPELLCASRRIIVHAMWLGKPMRTMWRCRKCGLMWIDPPNVEEGKDGDRQAAQH